MVQLYMSSVEEQRETMVQPYVSSMDSGSTSGRQTPSCVVQQGSNTFETSNLWEEWTQASNGDDTVSTSNFLPEISSFTSSRLSFQQSDSLTTWMSGFPPLSQTALSPDLSHSSDPVDHPPAFMQEGLGPGDSILDYSPALTEMYPKSSSKHNSSDCLPYPAASAPDKKMTDHELGSAISLAYDRGTVSRQLLRALGPLSPSSPLALQNGLQNPLGDPWDASPSAMPWPMATTGHAYGPGATRTSIPDHLANAINHLEGIAPSSASHASKPRHTDIFIAPNGTFDSTPGGWTPQYYDGSVTTDESVKAMKLIASLREAGHAEATIGFCTESKPSFLRGGDRTTSPVDSFFGKCVGAKTSIKQACSGKHPLELEEIVDSENSELNPTQLKRSKLFSMNGRELRSYSHLVGSSLTASQPMDIIAIGPALNTDGKPRAKRGSATDPQSVYARHRREKINERLKSLQNLVPNGAKVDIVTMLDEAIHYVKFLQNQVEVHMIDCFQKLALLKCNQTKLLVKKNTKLLQFMHVSYTDLIVCPYYSC
nr:uncharacterized protein LOC112293574 isoform X4 [Physcomitrium patens]|eukprot:XP_024398939.1 uncharacterized protein LOC112293574 isoform X4 [Physcomitrella patens]